MSKEIDERIVEMRFDNKQFESNVHTSMSTLDKLKQKLNLSGASKGLENIESAAKKVDINPLSKAAETVTAKFSALQVMGVTALANITNSAVNAGKRIASAFTIEPIKTGFNEYELKMNSVQTIMASTGASIETVNKYLDELNEYSDKTIYSFSDMTESIGKFTNAGVKLDDAVLAIKGISNEAAVSGANANEASRAMYNFAQALSSGYVKLIDWKSIENANMATVEFKQQLIDTAEKVGTLTKTTDGYVTSSGTVITATRNFNDSLQDQWMTTDVLIGTLKDYADETTDIGKKAFASAQDVKTFSMMMDTLKETAQSGWAKTWELLFGDLEEAKALWTSLTNFFGGIIDKVSDARNKLLEGALGKSFKSLSEKISGALKPIEKTSKAIETVTNTVKDYGKVVDEIIYGSWGNGQARWNKLTEAGYDWAHAQNLVNEKLNDSTRYATEYKEAQDKINDSQDKAAETQTKLSESDGKRIEQLASMSEAQLKNLGYTDEQIAAYEELRNTADKLGLPLSEFIRNMDEINGRWLLINSFKNIGKGIVKAITSIKDAYRDIFPPASSDQLFNIIAGFHKLSTHLIMNDDTADKLKRTFKGLFAVLDLIRTVVSGTLGIGFKVLKEVLSAFNLNILDVTANVGDAIVKFRDWVKEHDLLAKAIQIIVPYIKEAVTAVSQWIKNNEIIQNGIDKLSSTFDKATSGLKKWIDGIKETDNIPEYIISGLTNGLKSGISIVTEVIAELGKSILKAIKDVLGIHSPSTEFFEIGKNIIAGLINGLKNGLSSVLTFLGDIGKKCIEVISKIDFGKIFAVALSAGIAYFGKKTLDLAEKFAAPFEGIGNMFSGIGSFFSKLGEGLNKNLKAKALERKSKALLNLAMSVGIFAASIYMLAKLDSNALWTGVKAIWAIVGAISVLTLVASLSSKISAGGEFKGLSKIALLLVGMSVSLFILASAIKKLDFLNENNIKPIMTALAAIIIGMGTLIATVGNFPNIEKAGSNIYKMSAALLLMVGIIKLVSGMSPGEIAKGIICIVLLGGAITGLMAATKLAGKDIDKVGGILLKMSAAMLLMVIVIKAISGLKPGEIIKGIICMTLFGGLMAGLMYITKFASNNIKGIGSTLLGISAAMILMATTIKIVSGMSPGEIAKGLVCISLFGVIIAGLISATKLAGEGELKRVASTILAMSISIGILAAVAVVLSLIDTKGLAKGIIAVSILSIMMANMVKATKDAQNCKGSIIAMTIAIGIMAAAVAALSFIDPSKLAGATAAMSILMVCFGFMAKMASTAKTSIASLAIMTVAVGLLAGIIYVLSNLPIESVLSSAASLSMLLLSLSASLAILNAVGAKVGTALTGAVGLLALCVPLVAFVGILALMQNIQNAISNAIVLGTFTVVMTGVLAALTFIGTLGPAAIIGVGSLLGLAVPLVAFVGILALMQNIQNAESNANILISLMTAMTTLLAVVSILGPLALVGVGAITSMTLVMTALAGLVVAIGALNEKFPQLETFVDSGISLLIKLSNGLGQVIGNFVSGFAQGVSSGLPEVATNLSNFMINLTPFIVGAKMIDESTMNGVKSLAETILILTGAGILEGITSWITGGSSITEFANQLAPFGKAIKSFANEVADIDGESVTNAANAGKVLSEMAKSLPREGGWIEKLIGGKDLSGFSDKIVSFGKSIKSFANEVEGIDGESVTSAANAGKVLSEMVKSLPREGGWIEKLIGNKNLSSFSDKITSFGKAIKSFSKEVKGVDGEAVTNAANAGKVLSEMAKSLPREGGWWSKIVGGKDLSSFSDKITSFGKAIKSFSNEVKGISSSAINNASSAIKEIINMAKNANGVNFSGLASLSSTFSNVGNNLISKFANAIKNGTNKMKSVMSSTINSMISSTKGYYSQFSSAGAYLVDGFARGISSNTYKAKAKASAMAKAAYDSARKELDERSPSKKFAQIGSYAVEGFANGIRENVGDVNKAATNMSKGVLEATQDVLGIHSPSVVFDEKVGRYIVKGIAEGIKKDMSAEEAAEKKAQNIVSAFQNELDRIERRVSNREKGFNLWKLTDGKAASDSAIIHKQMQQLNDDLYDYNEKAKLAKGEWETFSDIYGPNSKYTEEAYGKMLDAQIKAAETAAELLSAQESLITNEEELAEKRISINSKKAELMELQKANGELITYAEIDRANLSAYEHAVQERIKMVTNAQQKYDKLLNDSAYGPEHKETLAALEELMDARKKEEEAKTDLFEYEQSIYDRNVQNLEDQISRNEKENKLWELVYGEKASDRNRYLYYKNQYEEDAIKYHQVYQEELNRYNDFVKDYAEKNKISLFEAKKSEEAKKQWDKVLEAQINEYEARKKVNDNRKDYLEQEKEDLKDQYELTSDIADIKYQIWEKTDGRKATDVEKDTMKLAFLSEQLGAQAKLVKMAKAAWSEATGNDKQKKEKEYYQAQLELANLQSEVLDIQEENTKRQERALEKQRNAYTEYEDYIKKYEQYYLDHGMTKEELEKDARLVSGYDPNNAVKSMISKTTTALNNLQSNTQYNSLLSSFGEMGSSYASAVSEGIQNGTNTVIDTTSTLVKNCLEKIKSEKEEWTKVGITLVEKFIEGIKSKIQNSVDVATELASRTLEAIKNVCDGNMDYSPTIRPVLDMSDISSKSNSLNSIFGSTSLRLASSVSSGYATSKSVNSGSGQPSGATYSFVQNNYSPKALSSIEIYRQTNNIISKIGKKE